MLQFWRLAPQNRGLNSEKKRRNVHYSCWLGRCELKVGYSSAELGERFIYKTLGRGLFPLNYSHE